MEITIPTRKDAKTDRAKARVGEKHGMLTIEEWLGADKRRNVVYRWSCECGGSCVKTLDLVKKVGEYACCGCADRKPPGPLNHGYSRRGRITAEYMVWKAMRVRCSPKCPENAWPYYYGKGIRVCDRWDSFDNFITDMGPRPSDKHQIDRINSSGNYEPSNCQWLLGADNTRKAVRERWERVRAEASK